MTNGALNQDSLLLNLIGQHAFLPPVTAAAADSFVQQALAPSAATASFAQQDLAPSAGTASLSSKIGSSHLLHQPCYGQHNCHTRSLRSHQQLTESE